MTSPADAIRRQSGHRPVLTNATRSPSAVTTAANTTPAGPAGQGSLAPGRALKRVATAAIQLDGTHASWATSAPTAGSTGSSRHASKPSTVAIGAAGPTRVFARTPYRGTVGASMISTGWQANWAEIGTAISTASGSGIQLASLRAIGPARRSSPAVASTDSTKP